ncbi:MAG: hypothetical protein WC508_02770 [Patescibacteria group bacterium]
MPSSNRRRVVFMPKPTNLGGKKIIVLVKNYANQRKIRSRAWLALARKCNKAVHVLKKQYQFSNL